ncbi:PduM family microcompartment protein [Photobacterium sp. DNB22_13_2]
MTIVNSSRAIALHPKQLESGLDAIVEQLPKGGLDELHIVLPDLPFLLALFELNSSHKAVQTVMEAWSIGLQTLLIIHRQLLPILAVEQLEALPVTIRDHKGIDVFSCDKPWINYSDVAVYSDCWLLTRKKVQFTDLAREHMQNKHIQTPNKRSAHVSR